MSDLDYSLLPEHLRAGVKRYIEHRIIPGSFLVAVITNDLRKAVFAADSESLESLPDIVRWFHNEAPGRCWGSAESMAKWTA